MEEFTIGDEIDDITAVYRWYMCTVQLIVLSLFVVRPYSNSASL